MMVSNLFLLISGKKAVDGEAQNSVPILISELTNFINQTIQDERDIYNYVSTQLSDGATRGKELSQGTHFETSELSV
jgi:hypothetical protein